MSKKESKVICMIALYSLSFYNPQKESIFDIIKTDKIYAAKLIEKLLFLCSARPLLNKPKRLDSTN